MVSSSLELIYSLQTLASQARGGQALSIFTGDVSTDAQSLYSGETLAASTTPVFGVPLARYTRLVVLPLAEGHLTKEMTVFCATSAGGNPVPLLLVQAHKLHFLTKNAPLLTTYIHENGQKREFCKVYFRILHNNLTCHVLEFELGLQLAVYNNALGPYSDLIYRGTKLRVGGAAGAASTFGTASARIDILGENTVTLADGAVVEADRGRKVRLQPDNALFTAVRSRDRFLMGRLSAAATAVVNVPVASFTETERGGQFRIYEVASAADGTEAEPTNESQANPEGVSYDTLVLATVLLVMVEPETRKMRGSSRPRG